MSSAVYWEWIACIAETVAVPVIANGELWSVEDYRRCCAISGVSDAMLGRGLVSRHDLAWQVRGWHAGAAVEALGWYEVLPMLQEYWRAVCAQVTGRHALGRFNQWLRMLAENYGQAAQLFVAIRTENCPFQVELWLHEPLLAGA